MKKWLLGILAAIGSILAIILGIGKNKRVKELKNKIRDNEKKVKAVDTKIKSTEKQSEEIKKSLKSKKQALKDIKKQEYKKKNIGKKEASDFLKKYSKKK